MYFVRIYRAFVFVFVRYRFDFDLWRAFVGYFANYLCGGVLMYVVVKGGEKAIDVVYVL